jgi:prophage regulatory protein
MQTSPSERHDPEQATQGATPQTQDGPVTVTPLKPGKLIRLPIVEERTCLKKSSIYAGGKAGTFPLPVRLSARAVAWRESDIDLWIAERLTTRGE